MNFTEQEYLENTTVSTIGAGILMEISLGLPFLADLTHREVVVLVPNTQEQTVMVVAQATPFMDDNEQFTAVGSKFDLRYERIVAGVLKKGKPISGYREVRLGVSRAFDVYPIFDNAGLVLAAIGFVGSDDEVQRTFLKYVYRVVLSTALSQADFEVNIMPHDGVLLFNNAGSILYANEVGERLINLVKPGGKVGFQLDEGADILPVVKARLERKPIMEEWVYKGHIWRGRALPISDSGKIISVLLLLTDVTVIKQQEKELFVKDVVIREIHHRVKNNLQTVAGLLRMQGRRVDEKTRSLLQQAERRIHAIASIHHMLAEAADDTVDAGALIEDLVGHIRQEWTPFVELEFKEFDRTIRLDADRAVAFGMVAHELIQNACEHGSLVGSNKAVIVQLLCDHGKVEFLVRNLGVVSSGDKENEDRHLGLQLVDNLVKANLSGTFSLENRDGYVVAHCCFECEEAS